MGYVYTFLAIFFIALPVSAQSPRVLQLRIEAQCAAYGAASTASRAGPENIKEPSDTAPKLDGDVAISAMRLPARSVRHKGQCRGKPVRLPPRYPNDPTLARQAPSACVFLQFDTDIWGGTKNISILQRFPEGDDRKMRKIDKAATQAVGSWCYEQKRENKRLVRREGLETKVSFLTIQARENWERPKSGQDYAKRLKNRRMISEASCKTFSQAVRKLQKNPASALNPSPSEENFPGFTGAIPETRSAPEWPDTIPTDIVSHACVYALFDVTAQGTTKNIRLVHTAPAKKDLQAFGTATIEAIATWQYRPALFNEQPAAQKNLLAALTFSAGDVDE